ncbi:MAG: Dabb family protein [Propionicimonas sp.]|uniref:Dabb family protein n=1 Tax=Propionicimonas sp. TaxID=1955623 RepID=UPI003D0DD756
MIKHIVMWNFADEAEGQEKESNLADVRDRLAGLRNLVPGIVELEPVIPVDPFEHSYDLVLYSVFDSPEALKAYATHPEHVQVATFIRSVATDRVCVDYEV